MIIQLGDIQQGAQKVGKATVFFRFPSKLNQISAGLNQDQQWVILGVHGVSAPVLRNNGSQYYQLYHPGTPDESISVRNIVNSSVQQVQGCNMCESRLFLSCQGHNI